MHYRYWIWAVKHRDEDIFLLMGLGRKKDAQARWRQILDDPPLLTLSVFRKFNRKYKYVVYAKCETRAEVRFLLLQARARHKNCIVEDWTNELGRT